jgi:4-diphosphocytidyl-2C-methyl-D-erythritol kinase
MSSRLFLEEFSLDEVLSFLEKLEVPVSSGLCGASVDSAETLRARLAIIRLLRFSIVSVFSEIVIS